MSWSGAMERIASHIRPLVIERLDAQKHGKALPESSSTPQQRTVTRIVQQIIALIFASAHQLPLVRQVTSSIPSDIYVLVFVIYNLCLHPEYIPPLTTELENMLSLPQSAHYKNTPLLESFLRESARMNPLDSVSIQRKVMQPFTLSNGTHIPIGNTICVPQAALMHSPNLYTSPSTFNGYRFVLPEDRDATEPKIKYTDVNAAFPFWGASRKAWLSWKMVRIISTQTNNRTSPPQLRIYPCAQ
ncbi:cytochrome P450 protein [Rutstroemia sp. NJR-2017a BBW]|nr:cytochrome P450 protein [Rutstroemia sp. NJR-2017a BBW]